MICAAGMWMKWRKRRTKRKADADMGAATFEEHIAVVGTESPPALVMDWWRRLELTLRERYGAPLVRHPGKLERAIARDPNLGSGTGEAIRRLRKRRNAVAHEPGWVSREEARRFARDAFRVVGVLLAAPARGCRDN